MMRLIALLTCLLTLLLSGIAQERYKLNSPNGRIELDFFVSKGGNIGYTICVQGNEVIERSKLGILREDGDFTTGMRLVSIGDVIVVNERYTMIHGKKSINSFTSNEQVFRLENGKGEQMDIIFRLFNDGVAFRYFFSGSATEKKRIVREVTSFNFPDQAKAWLQPMQNAKEDWAATSPAYEEYYRQEMPVGIPSPKRAGWAFPSLFKVRDTWALISETAPYGDYCGSRLHQLSPDGEYAIDFSDEREVFPEGDSLPESELPWQSPWRVIALGNLKSIVESTLGTDLAKSAKSMDWSFVRPGKASWSWGLLKGGATYFKEQKRFIDHAAEMKWDYCLIDADWDRQIGYDKVEELVRYGQSKQVGIWLWYNSSGPWNGTTYTPKSKLLTRFDRRKEFLLLQKLGVKGIKVDFFGGDGQSMMDYYIDILEDAADYQLMVNFHGCTIPRGWQRTYPNLLTAEAVRGFEFITFTQSNADRAPNHCAMLPFTRNVFDPMDFTPLSLDTIPNIERKTSKGFELALPVLFYSGVQHFPETPEGLTKQSDFVKAYLRELPASWDDVRFIDGYPGKYAVIARRSGNCWYIGGINGESIQRDIILDLSFLNGKECILIEDDDKSGELIKKHRRIKSNSLVTLRPFGGFVMIIN